MLSNITREDLLKEVAFLENEKFLNRTRTDQNYMNLISKILLEGEIFPNRTGIDTIGIIGSMLEHDMDDGFPLLTTKKVMYKAMAVELEGFVKGITDKHWYIDRKCNIWNEWCNPKTKDYYDLGKFYGYQWRQFNDNHEKGDQLYNVIEQLIKHKGSNNRRLIVSAWNPLQIDEMALPPCHIMFQLLERGDKLNLLWYQRSCDTLLGVPFNLASYSLLLALICKTTGHVPGKVIGHFADVHLYMNHMDPILKQFIPQAIANEQNITALPKLIIKDTMTDIFEFDAGRDIEIVDYKCDPFVKAEVAV